MPLLVFDLDGTILEDDHSLSENTVETIDKLIRLGFFVTIATGRSLKNSYEYVEKLPLNLPVILLNGVRIYDHVSKKYLYERILETDVLRLVLEIYNHSLFEVSFFFFANEQVLALNPNYCAVSYLWRDSLTYTSIVDSKKILQEPVAKIVISASENKLDKVRRILFQLLENTARIVRSESDIIEILPYDANKGTALRILCGMYGIDSSEVMAVGDSENDIEMLECAGFGVSAGNANALVRSVSKLYIPAKGYQLVERLYKLIKEGEIK